MGMQLRFRCVPVSVTQHSGLDTRIAGLGDGPEHQVEVFAFVVLEDDGVASNLCHGHSGVHPFFAATCLPARQSRGVQVGATAATPCPVTAKAQPLRASGPSRLELTGLSA